MRVISLKDVLEFSAGETIPSFKGRVTSVYDPKTGKTGKGDDYHLQNIMVKDASGVELKVLVADREPLPRSLKGQDIYVFCKEGDKGLSGIKAKDDEYRGKITRFLSVTPTATIEIAGQGQGSQTPRQTSVAPPPEASDEPPPQDTPPEPPARQSAPQPSRNGNGNGNHESKVTPGITQAAARRCRDYWIVLDAVKTMADAWDAKHPERKFTPELFQAATSTVYIQLQRDGVINGH